MNLSQLLKLQLVYVVLGLGYNSISLLRLYGGNKPLSATSPLSGIFIMLVYGLFLLTGYFGYDKVYRLLMALAFLILGYGGVLAHLQNAANLSLYASTGAWVLAIAINLYGALLNLTALAGRFTSGGRLHL
jgi:hypothetical protein